MAKRLRISVSEQDFSHFQAAARRAGLPLAEWALHRISAWHRAQARGAYSLNLCVRETCG